jgi:hypothetical protein
MMYCPNCGADAQTANAYCKRCGEWLPDIKSRSRVAFGGETPQQNIFTGLFMSALSTFAALFSAIALYATYLGRGDAKWSVYFAAAFCLCIAGWQASSFIVTLKLGRRMKQARNQSEAPGELDQRQTSPSLKPADVGAFVATPSVTENTTQMLDARAPKPDRAAR